MSVVHPPHCEYRPRGSRKHYRRIIGGFALRGHKPIVFKLFAGLVFAVGHAVGSDGGGNIHHHPTLAVDRKAYRNWIRRKDGLCTAVGRNACAVGI